MKNIQESVAAFIDRLTPRDVIAVILLGICVTLKIKGIDGEVSVAMAAIIGYYLSKRVYEEKHTRIQ